MDSIVQMIVDILRSGKENNALNKGGLTAGTPQADALLMQQQNAGIKHGGQTPMEIVDGMQR